MMRWLLRDLGFEEEFCAYVLLSTIAEMFPVTALVHKTTPPTPDQSYLSQSSACLFPTSLNHLKHHNTNSTSTPMNLIPPIHPARNGIRPIIIQIIMQLAIAAAKTLLFQEPIVVLQRQRIEDIELVLLSEDQGVVHECVETSFVIAEGGDGWDAESGGVVVAVGRADVGVQRVVDYAGFEAVEGEEVG